ncbi:hypothetical protein K2Z83_27305 [Oscillochloris sp. ZM17-4]|uniref:hypothetical protein n=1 Tax=Oscillochloris sp. ZM17-4 TaxID=2866714 RepID=UPI001C733285|nr:hypothetical protein [Oscillochloris sp. ZM17-4]MBX0331364.1 hypothetical protein [Oscillochloris sp. ZM17-4]
MAESPPVLLIFALSVGLVGGFVLLMAALSRRWYGTGMLARGRPAASSAPPAKPVSAALALPAGERPLPPAAWLPLLQDRPNQVPHLAILGPSGSGKSTLMEALARQRVGQVLIIQPNRRAGEWLGAPVIECDDDGGYRTIAQALERLRAEFTRRGGAMKRGDPGPWLTVVWDEVPLCIGKLGKPARELMVDLLSAGRPRHLRLIAGSTSDRVGALGIEGYGDLLESCAIMRLGSFAVTAAPAAGNSAQPTTIEVGGKTSIVERGPTLAMARQSIDPARIWVWDAPDGTTPTTVFVGVATGQSAPIDDCATGIAESDSPLPEVAQRDWRTVADLVRAGAVGETAALRALGFPPSSTSPRYRQARAALKAAIEEAMVCDPTSLHPPQAPQMRRTTTP